jgi:endonuclease/exonuclease/phosphatase family metal-dependent hydrolase
MKKHFCYFVALLWLLVYSMHAQSLADLSFGSDATLDVMTWNIEHFPKFGQATVDSVSLILQSLQMDVYALQEISDTTTFKQMVDALDGYDYYFLSSWFGGLAYVYNSSEVAINDIYEIYTQQPYWRPFPRAPMLMDMSFHGEQFYIINNHFKAFGDGVINYSDPWDEETRRYDASNLLKDYIDTNLPAQRVIVLGDMNDLLTDTPPNNVFQTILDDDAHYLFADMAIAQGASSGWSYPGWPSHLDHLLITDELFSSFSNSGSHIQTLIMADYMAGGFNQYDLIISDHYPVALQLAEFTEMQPHMAPAVAVQLCCYPNPFNPTTTLRFSVPDAGDVELAIYTIRGEKVTTLLKSFTSPGTHQVQWDGRNNLHRQVASGVYVARLVTSSGCSTQKMLLLK